MITREKTNLYLNQFNLLTEALYLCWHNAYSEETQKIDEEILRQQIRSHGFYPHKNTIKRELPVSFRNKLTFKNLTWVNNYTDTIAEDTLCEHTELHKQAITEVEYNLFLLSNKSDKIAYANIILCDLDKSYIHNKKLDDRARINKYKQMFEYVLDHNFIAEDNVTINDNNSKIYPIYDLTVRLINHFHFIDKLIDLFLCFGIDLVQLNEKSHYNLFIFENNKYEKQKTTQAKNESIPKFDSSLSDECLVKIMLFLKSESWLEDTNSDDWLYWFNRKPIINQSNLVWKGSSTMLSNVMQHLCTRCCANTVKTAFGKQKYVKPTWSDYNKGNTYKKIEQIITIANKKTPEIPTSPDSD